MHECIRTRRLRFAHHDAKERLEDVALVVGIDIPPEPRVDERLTQRRALHPQQRMVEDLDRHHALHIRRIADDPAQREKRVLLE